LAASGARRVIVLGAGLAGLAAADELVRPGFAAVIVEFKAGQLTAFDQFLRLPENRIHFAGEHTSPWNG
jgi:monoamine oxidase